MLDPFYLILIITTLLVLWYNTCDPNYIQYMTDKIAVVTGGADSTPVDPAAPLYANFNIKDICRELAKNDAVDDAVDVNDPTIPQTPEEQVADLKQKNMELKLKLEDHDSPYSYKNNDLFLVDDKKNIGDDVFTLKMLEMSKKNKQAIDARSMWSKESLLPWYEEELEEHSNGNAWWESSDLENSF